MPELVAPTNRISPCLSMMVSSSTGGSFRSANRGISSLTLRMTIDTSLRCLKMLTRKRPMPVREIARFISRSRSNSRCCSASISEAAMAAVSPSLNGCSPNATSTPSIRALGGAPVERNRSEPFLLDKIDNSASISMAKITREAFNEQKLACT